MGPRASSVAIRWLGRAGQRQDVTYDELRRQTGRFANLLQRRGVRKGEVVATLMGRVPALYAAALGTLKNGSVYTPLFSAFGPDPIVARLTKARARVLVTTTSLYQRKVLPVRALLPDLEHVLLVRDGAAAVPDGAGDLAALMLDQDDTFEIPPTDPQDLAYGTKMRVIVVIEAPERKGQPARCEIFKRPADFLAPCGL
jgi:acetyl-CoA synthetase